MALEESWEAGSQFGIQDHAQGWNPEHPVGGVGMFDRSQDYLSLIHTMVFSVDNGFDGIHRFV